MEAKKEETKIDYLDEDAVIPKQLFCVLSFLSPEGVKNCSMRGIKVRGVYPTAELAQKRAEELRQLDPYFDIFVAEVGKWCAWDDKDKTYDTEYNNKQLNSLMKTYKENKDKSNLLFEQRKNEMQSGKYENRRQQRMKEREKKKVNFSPAPQQKQSLVTEEQMLKEKKTLEEIKMETTAKAKELDKEQKELILEREKIVKKEVAVSNMEERLKKVNEVYKKLSEK